MNNDSNPTKTVNLFSHLYASPYGSKTYQLYLTEEDFYRDYFVELECFKNTREKLNNLFEEIEGDDTPSFICLYGYAGTGKTTFLHWYLKHNLPNHNKLFFNMIDAKEPTSNTTTSKVGIPIFDTYFRNLIKNLFNERETIETLFHKLNENLFSLDEAFTTLFQTKIGTIYKAICENDRPQIIEIINETMYPDLLLLFLLLYSIKPDIISKLQKKMDYITTQNTSSPLLLVFDNIDHMEIEYSNQEFPTKINDVVHYYKQLQPTLGLSNSLAINCLFCLRDANFELVNMQITEISGKKAVLFNPNDLERVFQERMKKFANKTATDERQQLLHYLFERDIDYTKTHFLPLFNFNYRKMVEFIQLFTINGNSKIIRQLLQQLEQQFENLKHQDKRDEHIIRVRGTIYYFLIEHLKTNNYLKDTLLLDDRYIKREGSLENDELENDECGKMNAGRMLLTLIHNKSKYTLSNVEGDGYNEPVGLYYLYESYKKIFINDTKGVYFFECLLALYLCHLKNYSHLITFWGKPIFFILGNENFKDESKLLEKATKNDATAKKDLNEITIRLNSSGFTYLNEIMRHYEFFSLKAKNKKSLFTCMKLYEDVPEFISNIQKTYEETLTGINDLKKFIKQYSGGVEEFEKSEYCFKLYEPDKYNPDDSKPRLYLVRIIDTHISYIDSLRAYILETDVLRDKYKEKRGEDGLSKFMQTVNNQLIEYIEKYVEMLDGVSTAKKLMEFFKENLTKIKDKPLITKEQNVTKYNYISINQDRKEKLEKIN
ncbi:MAG: hypothetical protein LBT27_06365 [Prevotellaceae bacterium]|jgi:hypothetical protein|nr:hypothetical protein [Prevotellaceae bacterium]